MALIPTAFGTKVALAAIAIMAVGGGTAVAAAAIPSSDSQDIVQTDEPTATSTPTEDPTVAPSPDATQGPDATGGPDAAGPAAFGLCTAFAAGGLGAHSLAYTALLNASGSAAGVADYCAPILAGHSHRPSSVPEPEPSAPTVQGRSGSDHGQGEPHSRAH